MTPEQNGERETHIDVSTLNIYQRHLKACAVIDSMPWIKDQSNPQFKSVPIDAMRAGVRRACIVAGMVHHGPFSMDYVREVEVRKDKFGVDVGKTFRYHGEAKFRLINVDDPSDYMEWEVVGESMDTGDKGLGKLESAFIKNFYKAAFDIGEKGDDNDSYSNEEFDQFIATKRAEAEKVRQEAEQADREMAAKRQTILDNTEHPVVKAFIASHGRLPANWSDLDVIQCLIDLDEAKNRSSAEQAIVEVMGADAEFLDGVAIAETMKARRDAVNVGNARAILAQLKREDPDNEILKGYIEKFGGLSKLKDPQVIDCYLDLQDAGVVQ